MKGQHQPVTEMFTKVTVKINKGDDIIISTAFTVKLWEVWVKYQDHTHLLELTKCLLTPVYEAKDPEAFLSLISTLIIYEHRKHEQNSSVIKNMSLINLELNTSCNIIKTRLRSQEN